MANETSPLRVPAVLLTMVLTGALLHYGKFIFLPLIVAFLLCLVSRPLVVSLERRRIPSGLTVFGLMVLFVVAVVWVGGQLYDGAEAFVQSIDEAADQAKAAEKAAEEAGLPKAFAVPDEESTIEAIGRLVHEHVHSRDWRDLDLAAISGQVKALFPRVAALLLGALGLVQSAVAQVLLIVFFMIFIFAEQGVSQRKIRLAAGERRDEVVAVLERITADVQLYLAMKTGISLATAVLCWAGLAALGVPWASLFAILTFLLNFIPNVGSILAAVFPAVTALGMEGGGPGVMLAVFVLYAVVNVVFGNLVEPKVLGKQLNLSPLVILIALLFWGALWGISGMFLAVPLTRSAQLVFSHLPSLRWLALLMANDADEARLPATG